MIRSLTPMLLGVMLGLACPALGQNDDRPPIDIAQRMRSIIDTVVIDRATARQAFAWWSDTTGIPLVLDWPSMETQGIDPDQLISIRLQHVPANQLLRLLMQQTGHDLAHLIAEPSPWYVQVMTKEQANQHPVTRMYDVTDLLMEIPHFTDAPSLDLRDALSNTATGGNRQSLFADDEKNGNRPTRTTRQQRGENLAQFIRDAIEPTLWHAHGGDVASVTYLSGRLIVRAPGYIQRQIGMPLSPRRKTVAPAGTPATSEEHARPPGHVSGVGHASPGVSGTR